MSARREYALILVGWIVLLGLTALGGGCATSPGNQVQREASERGMRQWCAGETQRHSDYCRGLK